MTQDIAKAGQGVTVENVQDYGGPGFVGCKGTILEYAPNGLYHVELLAQGKHPTTRAYFSPRELGLD